MKKSGNKANTSSGEDHEMALPLVKKYWFPNQRCESTIKHSSMLVLCNQAFTNDTFSQWQSRHSITIQIRGYSSMYKGVSKIYVHGGQIFFGPVVRGTRKKLTVSEGRSTRIFYHYTRQIISPKKTQNTFYSCFKKF